jgi:hypothetical protein
VVTVWGVEINFIVMEKGDREVEESRGINAGYEILPIFDGPCELKIKKSGEDSVLAEVDAGFPGYGVQIQGQAFRGQSTQRDN